MYNKCNMLIYMIYIIILSHLYTITNIYRAP